MDFCISTMAYDLYQPIEPRLRDFSAAGFTAIDWMEQYATTTCYTQADAEEVLALCRKHGLNVHMMHGATHFSLLPHGDLKGRNQLWSDLNSANIRFLSRVGGKTLVLHLPNTGHSTYDEQLESSKQLLDALRPVAEECGVRLALENSPGILEPVDWWPPNGDLLAELLDCYPTELIGFCFDSGHANVRGEMQLLEQHASRLIAVHLHDNQGVSDEHLIPGQGTVDWPWVISVLKQSGYGGPLNLELAKPEGAEKTEWLAEAYSSISRLWDGR